MIRVLQATPTKPVPQAAPVVAAAGTDPAAGPAGGVVRAIIKTAAPAGQAPQVVRRVQLQPSGQVSGSRRYHRRVRHGPDIPPRPRSDEADTADR